MKQKTKENGPKMRTHTRKGCNVCVESENGEEKELKMGEESTFGGAHKGC